MAVMKQGRLAYNDLYKQWCKKERARHFRALKRAYAQVKQVAAFRAKTLKMKVFESYRRIKLFKVLKVQVNEIGINKYRDRLICDAFDSLVLYSARRRKLRNLLQLYRFKRNHRDQMNIYHQLHKYKVKSKAKKRQVRDLKVQLDVQTEVKVLRELFRFAAQSKVDKRITAIIKQRRHGIQARHYFEAWQINYHKLRIDRIRTEKIVAERENRLCFFGLQKWLGRQRHLRFAEQKLQDKTLHKVKEQNFSLWLSKYRRILLLRSQYEDLVTKVG